MSKVESMLLPENPIDETYFSLAPAGGADAEYFNLDDIDGYNPKALNRLEGEDAMLFLGLPIRPLCHMKKGDHSRIYWKFKRLFDRWAQQAEREGRHISKDLAFWSKVKIRVWNKANLEKLTPAEIVGKKTANCPSVPNYAPGRYEGDLMDGRALSTFLSEVKNSQRWREYFIQLVSVDITEDMQHVG